MGRVIKSAESHSREGATASHADKQPLVGAVHYKFKISPTCCHIGDHFCLVLHSIKRNTSNCYQTLRRYTAKIVKTGPGVQESGHHRIIANKLVVFAPNCQEQLTVIPAQYKPLDEAIFSGLPVLSEGGQKPDFTPPPTRPPPKIWAFVLSSLCPPPVHNPVKAGVWCFLVCPVFCLHRCLYSRLYGVCSNGTTLQVVHLVP
jgi:hypothetical protein